MIVDSSALIAVLLDEPEADAFRRVMLEASRVSLSAVTYVEASIVIAGRTGPLGLDCLNDLLNGIQAEIISFDGQQSQFAVEAWLRFGKGRHPACLNFGDCCSYALARQLREPLLFKGNDFSKTDLESAIS
jgi:ribonuclease VapC